MFYILSTILISIAPSKSRKWSGNQFCCMGLFVYVQLAARSRVGRRVECRTLSYGHRGGGATPRRWSVETKSNRARGLVESMSDASNVLLGTPRDIPRRCTITSHLVRKGGGPYPQRIWTVWCMCHPQQRASYTSPAGHRRAPPATMTGHTLRTCIDKLKSRRFSNETPSCFLGRSRSILRRGCEFHLGN